MVQILNKMVHLKYPIVEKWFWCPILSSLFFFFWKDSNNWSSSNKSDSSLQLFLNFRNSCTVNSNTKRPDSIKGRNKTMWKLNIDTYPRPSILRIRSAYISRETIREYILSRNNDVAIARLLSMHSEVKALTLTWKTKHIGASGLSILVIISPEN